MTEKNYVFIVTSIIYLKTNKPLSYAPVRSAFTPDERAKQTLKTIESIRSKVPQAKIVLIENGLQKDLPYNIANLVDQYIYVGDKKFVRWVSDSKFKNLGEVASLFPVAPKFMDADFYFKISGRYYLNDNFTLDDWQDGEFITLKYGESISTRLYGFKKSMFSTWRWSMLKGVPWLVRGLPIEYTMSKFIPKDKIKVLKRVGVSGLGSAFGDTFDE